MVFGDGSFKYTGVVEALGIAIPEKFKREFLEFVDLDLLDEYDYERLFNLTFTKSITWRSGTSISEKSLIYLNKIKSNWNYQKVLEVLLKISCEVDHPWNAHFLDKNLFKDELNVRDSKWSTHIAICGRDHEDSATNSLIEWAHKSNLNNAESNVLHQLGITLIWMTTTSNRNVRDRATKSLVKVFTRIPEKIVWFLNRYNDCNDPYLVERLYAAVYGAILNIENLEIVKDVALKVYDLQFAENTPHPHLLLRDYARGIMEFSFKMNLFSDFDIETSKFRPPYSSEWPLFNPNEFLNKPYFDEMNGYSITRSTLGFLNDFGHYTMSNIEDWSPSRIDEDAITEIELYRSFSSKLSNEFHEEYLELIDELETETMSGLENFRTLELLEDFEKEKDEYNRRIDEIEKSSLLDNWGSLKGKIIDSLGHSEKEEFLFVCRHGFSNRKVSFDEKWAQRWVCKRAFDFGWTKEKFERFERSYSNGGGFGREGVHIERIGKKYQWIAYHELLARMADNLKWKDDDYEYDTFENFEGPFLLRNRDIDPSLTIRSVGDGFPTPLKSDFWYQPMTCFFENGASLDLKEEWIGNKNLIPKFNELVVRENPDDQNDWYVLSSFSDIIRADTVNKINEEIWYRIKPYIVKKDDVEKFKSIAKDEKSNISSLASDVPTNEMQGFFGEFAWHPSYTNGNLLSERSTTADSKNESVEYIIPTIRYEWENGSKDHSIDGIIRVYMPYSQLIEDLNLSKNLNDYGSWVNSEGEKVFQDPTTFVEGPSCALIRKDIFDDWLDAKNMQLVWIVGGEKNLYGDYSERNSKFFRRSTYRSVFTPSEVNNIKLWFKEEQSK